MPLSLAWFEALLLGLLWRSACPEPVFVPPEEASSLWMRRLQQGENEALRLLFDRWKLPLLNYFYRALGSHADAEDLTLQTLTQVHRSAARYREQQSFAAWLFAIARNELRHELRRRRRKPLEPVAPEELQVLAEDQPTLSSLERQEAESRLLTLLQTFPERDRTALLLAAAQELSQAQIAQTLRVSVGHLQVILHRTRTRLRALFET